MIETESPQTEAQKDSAIDKAVADISKEYGKGAVIRMNEKVGEPIPVIPTGIYAVDYDVLGVGGLPRGRVVEVYGTESGGKTTLALLSIASAQRANGRAAFIDAEHALDPNWASKQGVDVDALLVSQPDSGEQALDIVDRLLASYAFDIVVVDSVAALVPKAELDGDMGDSHMGLQARLMSQALRKLNAVVYKSNAVLLFINQVRDRIGVTWGSPETTTGGRALKFYASVRLDVRRIGAVKSGETIIGNKVKIKAAKNKISPPFRETEVELLFDQGFDCSGSLVDAAIANKVVIQQGAWFSYKGQKYQGRSNAITALKEAGLLPAILTEVRALANA